MIQKRVSPTERQPQRASAHLVSKVKSEPIGNIITFRLTGFSPENFGKPTIYRLYPASLPYTGTFRAYSGKSVVYRHFPASRSYTGTFGLPGLLLVGDISPPSRLQNSRETEMMQNCQKQKEQRWSHIAP